MSIVTLNIESEIGPLKTVLLHRPGHELENLTPQYLTEMLFDDIPYLTRMREEHDLFAQTLRNQGCEVLYYQDLLRDVLVKEDVRLMVIEHVLKEEGIHYDGLRKEIQDEMEHLSSSELVDVLIGGLSKQQIHHKRQEKRLSFYIKENYPFYINPLPNLYFTRDPGVVMGPQVSISSMKTPARRRESFLLDAIMRYHDSFHFSDDNIIQNCHDSIEGGDILVLNKTTLAIGCSDRTTPEAIERLSESLFNSDSSIRQILVIQIPFARAYMHLDTVFTMVDYDKFTIFPGVEKLLHLFLLTPGNGSLKITPLSNLKEALKKVLSIKSVEFIFSGGGDLISAAREQWNDSTNTLAIAPGKVVTYNRNVMSNDTLRKAGVEVVEIEGSELVRGRGGPRCMSMPLFRESL